MTERSYGDSPFGAAIRSAVESEGRYEEATCPACGYRKRNGVVAGNYEVCCGCLRIIHVQSDLTFRVVKLSDAPAELREGLSALSGEEE
jgi:hypothetical protein